MPTFLLYSLKAAGCLAVFYLFYKLLLSRDTLHRMNRVLLCGVLLLSFLLPLCVITVEKELPGVSAAGIDVIPENYFRRDMVFENRIPDDTRDLMIIEEPEPAPEPFDWGVLLGIIYFAGMFATLGWTVSKRYALAAARHSHNPHDVAYGLETGAFWCCRTGFELRSVG